MRRICAISCSAFLFSILSYAQLPSSPSVFFGYSYSRGNAFTQGFAGVSPTAVSPDLNMNGWEASVEGKYLPWLGAVADFDWHYGSSKITGGCIGNGCHISGSRYEVMFGPRASVSIGRYRPFAHVLLGFSHQGDSGAGTSNSDASFATAIGGGLDYKLLKAVAARGQVDFLHTTLFNGSQGHLRFSAGLVFRF